MEEETKSSLPQSNNKKIIIWLCISILYVILLLGLGYIAFYEQYFNDVDEMLSKFMQIKKQYKLAQSDVSMINDLIKKEIDTSNSLQELASQSFHITLGAMLAFLSGSITYFFHKYEEK